jgi:hypothetical protein
LLRLTFYASLGEPATQARALGFRLCADATLRAQDNSLTATRAGGSWLVGGRSFRRFDCGGPVMLLVRQVSSAIPVRLGPFRLVRAGAALIWGDDELLSLRVPGWCADRASAYEVMLVAASAEPTSAMKPAPART